VSDSAAGLASLVLEQVAKLVGRLGPAQIRDLTEGRTELTVIRASGVPAQPAGADAFPVAPVAGPAEAFARTRQRLPGADVDVEVTRTAIMGMSSRDEAARYVAAIGTVAALRGLADGLGVRLASRERKADIIRKIVDATLGVELTARAMRGRDAAG
jgi:hypothetical protein